MILLLDTSTPVCKLSLVEDDNTYDCNWQSDRLLARKLLGFLYEKLQQHSKSWSDISAIGVFEGPGSFTGIRIGLTVMNTIADASNIPIVSASGKDWQNVALEKLRKGKNEKIILPNYGRGANITTPKK